MREPEGSLATTAGGPAGPVAPDSSAPGAGHARETAGNAHPPRPQTVADVVGKTLAELGVQDAFGVIGSGNLVVTNALCDNGARFHHARHECGAVCMADGYARVSGRVGVASVHQGPGLTNTMTGLAEAAKSRTPLLVVAGETPAAALTSNFRIDQRGLVESVGANADRVHTPQTAAEDTARAYQRALNEQRPVVLMLPIDVQAAPALEAGIPTRKQEPAPPGPAPQAISQLADLIGTAERPALIAGRGAVLADAREPLEALASKIGAILATSAPANGLFHGLPYAVGIAGAFASPLATELLQRADLILAFGASLNDWTTKHGALISPDARIAQIDVDPTALGRHRPNDLAVIGDAAETAHALVKTVEQRTGFRTPELAKRLREGGWRNEPFDDASTDEWIDPRTLTTALDNALPKNRIVAVDSGHFLGYPSMYLNVPDARSWIFPNGFQAVGLGLGNAIGGAIAEPGRPTVAAIGDGGAFMALPELETAVRLKLGNLLVLIYDDAAYGAEVHHFAPLGHDVSRVKFPDADLAAIARAAGARAATIRKADDVAHTIGEWLNEQTGHPLVLDAKINPSICAEWLEEAFRGG